MSSVRKKDRPEKGKYVIGIDSGASRIGIAVVSAGGIIKNYLKAPTLFEKGKENTIERIKSHIRKLIQQSEVNMNQIVGIGAGVPGP